jgi:chromosome segregation ATPase
VLALASIKARASKKDHFKKVRAIIKDIIKRLAAEATAEKGEKAFCDKGMKKALEARDKSEADLERLAGATQKGNSDIKKLTQDIADLSDDTAITKKGLLEASELRENESADNLDTIDVATEGRDDVKEALGVLADFLKDAKVKFVQTASYDESDAPDGAPEIFQDEYGGDQSSSKGIIGVLEVIVSDFDRTIKKVGEQEKAAVADFKKFKETAEKSIAKNKESTKAKKKTIVTLKDKIVDLEQEVDNTKKVLAGAMDELVVLESKCVAGEETYEDRVEKRKKEIDALKEALDTLENWKQ